MSQKVKQPNQNKSLTSKETKCRTQKQKNTKLRCWKVWSAKPKAEESTRGLEFLFAEEQIKKDEKGQNELV